MNVWKGYTTPQCKHKGRQREQNCPSGNMHSGKQHLKCRKPKISIISAIRIIMIVLKTYKRNSTKPIFVDFVFMYRKI